MRELLGQWVREWRRLAAVTLGTGALVAGCRGPELPGGGERPREAPEPTGAFDPLAEAEGDHGALPDGAPPDQPHAPRPTLPALADAPASVRRERGSLPLRAWRTHVRIYSELELDFERLANVAQWTRDRSFRWLSQQDFETEPIEVYLCDREEELRRLEAELPLPGARPLARTSKGGYFHSQSAVLLLVEPDRSTEWLLSHEMFHSVFRSLATANPPTLNEGLAEVVPSWILYGDGPSPESGGATYPEYEAVLEQLAAAGRVPPLRELVSLSRDEFHRDRWTHFSLSWSLARFLVESDDPAVQGRVPALLAALHADPWMGFCEVYDAAEVERLWRASLGLAD